MKDIYTSSICIIAYKYNPSIYKNFATYLKQSSKMSRRIREDISIRLFDPKMITIALFLVLLYFHDQLGYSAAQLQFGFYSETCPSAESIVRDVVQQAVTNDPGKAAVLLRLQFHDCFVEVQCKAKKTK